MRSIFFIVVGLLMIMVGVGCSRRTVPSTTTVKDSLIVKEVPRLVEVKVPGDTVTVTDYIECDSTTNKPKPKNIRASNGKAHVSVAVADDGKLTAFGGCDSLKAVISALDREVYHLRYEHKTEPVIIYRVHWYDKVCRWIAGLTVSSFIGFIGFLFIKSRIH